MRIRIAGGFIAVLVALASVSQVGGQSPAIRITFLDCDSNPEVVFIVNLGSASQDLTGWMLYSDPIDDPSQRFDLSAVGSLAAGDRARIFSGGGPPSSDPTTGRYLWEANSKYRDGDPTDFVQVLDATGAVVDQLNCGEEAFLPTPGAPEQPLEQDCDPSYPDVCIPVGADDYDCLGGTGDGPNYIEGPLQVLPPDPHGLDPDGDGTACEAQATSEVAGVAQAPDGPVAGFGPHPSDGGNTLGLLLAGLVGAGIAWLIAGTAGVGFAVSGARGSSRGSSVATPFDPTAAARARPPGTGDVQDGSDAHRADRPGWLVAARGKLTSGPVIEAPRFNPRR